MPIDFQKTPADKRLTLVLGPGDPLGIVNVAVPTANELNNVAGVSGLIPASQSVSWNDFDLGFQESDTANEPSLADEADYEEFTTTNYGGALSMYLPTEYDDDSSRHSVLYDLTDVPGAQVTAALRIDGDVRVGTPFANGDFVHVMELKTTSETNPFNPGESTRRTVGLTSAGDFAHYTIVGPHTLTAIAPSSFAVGDKGRIRVTVQSRDYTNALVFKTSNANVVDVQPGGFYEIVGAGSATITIEDVEAGTSTTVAIVAP